jgi:hypothetical protein
VSADEMAVVERFNEGVGRGDLDPELIDPQIVVVDHDIPDAGSYHGHEGMRRWVEDDWGSAWDCFTIQPEMLEDAGDVALSVFTIIARGKGSGVETRRRNAMLASVTNGRLTRLEYYTTEEEARAAAKSTS